MQITYIFLYLRHSVRVDSRRDRLHSTPQSSDAHVHCKNCLIFPPSLNEILRIKLYRKQAMDYFEKLEYSSPFIYVGNLTAAKLCFEETALSK